MTSTSTSSDDPSEYVTTTVPFLFPAVLISTFSFQVYLASFGKSFLFLIPSDASGSLFNSVVTFWPSGVYLSASDLSSNFVALDTNSVSSALIGCVASPGHFASV